MRTAFNLGPRAPPGAMQLGLPMSCCRSEVECSGLEISWELSLRFGLFFFFLYFFLLGTTRGLSFSDMSLKNAGNRVLSWWWSSAGPPGVWSSEVWRGHQLPFGVSRTQPHRIGRTTAFRFLFPVGAPDASPASCTETLFFFF